MLLYKGGSAVRVPRDLRSFALRSSKCPAVEDVEGGSLSELNVLRHPIQVEDSFFVPPSVPGHGITFDWEALARWEVAIDAVVDAMLQTDTPDGKIAGANPPPARGNVTRTRVTGT
jgi:hypothetical protein